MVSIAARASGVDRARLGLPTAGGSRRPAAARAVLAAVTFGAAVAACAGPPTPPPRPGARSASAPAAAPASPLARAPLASPGGTHTIVADHSGKCLDVEGGLADDGVPVALWACHARPHQLWTVRDDAGGGGSRIVAAHSGKCLGLAGVGAEDEGYAVQQPCGAGAPAAGQGWNLQRLAGNRYRLVSTADGRCLDADGGGVPDGTRVLGYDCVPGARHQEWILAPASLAAAPTASPTASTRPLY